MGDTPTTSIGPGLGAFIAFFALAVLLWFLMRNMNARMRRMAYAERERTAALDAEAAATGEDGRDTANSRDTGDTAGPQVAPAPGADTGATDPTPTTAADTSEPRPEGDHP